jgi:hypothetical protein
MDPDDCFPPGTPDPALGYPDYPYRSGKSGYHSYNKMMRAEALDQKSHVTFNSLEEVERLKKKKWDDVSQAIWGKDDKDWREEELNRIMTNRSVYVPIGPFDQETVSKALLRQELPGYPQWQVVAVHSLGPNSDKVLVVLGRK